MHAFVDELTRLMESDTLLHRLYDAIGPLNVRAFLETKGLERLISDLERHMEFDESE